MGTRVRVRGAAHLLGAALGVACTACGAALSAPFTPPEAGGAPWVELASPHFTVDSDLSPSDARDILEQLERAYGALQDIGFNYVAKPGDRTRVVVFRREAEYRAVAPYDSEGFFAQRARIRAEEHEPLAVLYGDLTERKRRVVQHELTHRFVRFYYPKAPTWLNEGLAHYFETMSLENGYAVLGRPPFLFHKGSSWIHNNIPTDSVPDVRQLLAFDYAALNPDRGKVASRQDEDDEMQRATANRAASWAFVHLLRNGPPAYRACGQELLKQIGAGARFELAWSKASALLDASTLEADFRGWLVPPGREVIVLRTPYTPRPAPSESERTLPPEEVHLLWAALREGHQQAEIAAALRLAPGSVEARLLEANVLQQQGAFDAAESELKSVLASNPDDPRCLFALFRFYARLAAAPGGAGRFWSRAEALIPRLLPRVSSAYMENGLAWHLGVHGRAAEATPLIERALKVSPDCWECYDTYALLLANQGAIDQAVEVQSMAVALMPDGVVDRGMLRRLDQYKAAAQGGARTSGDGSLSASVIRTIVARRRGEVQRCYEGGKARTPALAGKVVVRFVVAADGTVASPVDGGSTLPDKSVIQCVLDEIAKLRFPARNGGSVTLEAPFDFAPSDGGAAGAPDAPAPGAGR